MNNQSANYPNLDQGAILRSISNKAIICAWVSFALCLIFPVFSLATTAFAVMIPLPVIGAFLSLAFLAIKFFWVACIIAFGIGAIINAITFFVKYKKSEKTVQSPKLLGKSIGAIITSAFSLMLLAVNIFIVTILTIVELGFGII